MRKRNIIIIVILALIVVAWMAFRDKKTDVVTPATVHPNTVPTSDYTNATYEIEGMHITLKKGYSQMEDPETQTAVETKYFGNHVEGDFNGDGFADVVILLTQNPGGSGTFYYAALALGRADGSYSGANAVYLGDRIAPQTTEYRNGQIIVNYAERKQDDAMTAEPSVAVSRYFKVVNGKLAEI